jgi:hypothetical protein
MAIDLPVQRQQTRSRRSRPDAVIGAAALLICAAILAAISWSHPTAVASTLTYTQSGSLSYSAPATPGSVYGGGGVSTGQPVYGATVNALNVTYAYKLQSGSAVDAAGTEQLVASISDGNGLSRTVPLQPAPAPFSGTKFTATGTLRLSDLQAIVDAFDQVAGASAAQSYAVSIAPAAVVHGHIAGRAFGAAFSPPVSFAFGQGNLLPAAPSGGQPSFTSSARGALSVPAAKPAQLLFGISVVPARIGSLVALLGALLVGSIAGWPLLRDAMSDDERARITARHGSSVIEAETITAAANVVVVHVDSFEGLLQVARQLECPVLHWSDGGDVYAVVVGSADELG